MLRPALPSDSEVLLGVAVATGLFTPDDAAALLGGVLDDLHAGRLPNGHLVSVWIDPGGIPRGWMYAAPDVYTDGVWNLWWIGVAPSHHGQGIGTTLLSAAESAATEAQARLLVIETSALEPLAQTRHFYEHRGYTACGLLPDFYGVGDGKVIFAKQMRGASA